MTGGLGMAFMAKFVATFYLENRSLKCSPERFICSPVFLLISPMDNFNAVAFLVFGPTSSYAPRNFPLSAKR